MEEFSHEDETTGTFVPTNDMPGGNQNQNSSLDNQLSASTSNLQSSFNSFVIPELQPSSQGSSSSQIQIQIDSSVLQPYESGPGGSGEAQTGSMTCRVCGDSAKSYHFGGISCDACKAFFRRSVISDTHTSFNCVEQQNCDITVETRRNCQLCRFKKCEANGMDKTWVLGNAKYRAAEASSRKQKPEERPREADMLNEDLAKMEMYLSLNETTNLEQLVADFHQSQIEFPYEFCSPSNSSSQNNRASLVEIAVLFTTILRRIVFYLLKLPHFATLPQSDQIILLRDAIFKLCQLTSDLSVTQEYNIWPCQPCPMAAAPQNPPNSPGYILCGELLNKLVKPDITLCEMRLNFTHSIQKLEVDEPVIIMLAIISIFESDQQGLKELTHVRQCQEYYLELLRKYTMWRYQTNGSKMFAKFLGRLVFLRELTDTLLGYIEQQASEERWNIWNYIERLSGTGESGGATLTTTPTTPFQGLNDNYDVPQLPSVTSLVFIKIMDEKIVLLLQDLHAELAQSDEAVANNIINKLLLDQCNLIPNKDIFWETIKAFSQAGYNLPITHTIQNPHFSHLQQVSIGLPEVFYGASALPVVTQYTPGSELLSLGPPESSAENSAYQSFAQTINSLSTNSHRPPFSSTTTTATPLSDILLPIATNYESVNLNYGSNAMESIISSSSRSYNSENYHGAYVPVSHHLAIGPEPGPEEQVRRLDLTQDERTEAALRNIENPTSGPIGIPFELLWPEYPDDADGDSRMGQSGADCNIETGDEIGHNEDNQNPSGSGSGSQIYHQL